ncbi:GNAT family N-acetyltransferase [Idiomarina sp. M1R2S28]|uniref:GNAT family N-acetyltransferase n=1 Tax=Idiomarina rhizosphaerae TaxID=2961572 RepID=A0A9X2JT82_9GAMM|nr:GNAT family N-acetyltransferase [Idiomarina rhizosphaerae]MCP1339600.1 GNAT family N-acetyltransferase [Idiomarina rhizosphaerae]
MKKLNYIINDEPPTAREYLELRGKLGWDSVEQNIAKKSLDNSLFNVSIRHAENLIGMARVVGDGFIYFYIQDVLVSPEYQGYGIGRVLMERVENYLSKACPEGSTIGLLAAKGKEAFYQNYEFIARDGENLGKGMCRFVRK